MANHILAAIRKVKALLSQEPENEEAFPDPVGEGSAIVTFFELPCLAVYAYLAGGVALCCMWACYRAAAHKLLLAPNTAKQSRGGLREPLLRRPEKPEAGKPYKQSLTDEQGRVITFEGYRDCLLGKCVAYLLPLTTTLLFCVFGVVLYDYYHGCAWEWPVQLCYIGDFPIFGTFETNSAVFLVVWNAGVLWFAMMIKGSNGSMVNLFRLRVPLVRAEHVHITVEEKTQVISSGYSRMLKFRDALLRLIARLMGYRGLPGGLFSLSGGPSQTVTMQRSQDGGRFLDFRCICYALEEDTGFFYEYAPASALPEGFDALLGILDAGGLRAGGDPSEPLGAGTPSVARMFRAAGPNEIPFSVDTWASALAEEFATFFFLYQFAIYAVCLWFSYWHFTILALTVAICSALYNVKVKVSSQRAIKGMMEQTAKATVLRSSQLVEIDAKDIVPGDILRVGSDNWLVPCDLLLLRGAAVCDESTLTGESMPVQRLAPTEGLKVEKGQRFPAKHVLVAGTEVLQVADDTWAVATHTGVTTQKGQLILLILFPPRLLFKYDEQLTVVSVILVTYAMFVMFATMKMMYVRYGADQQLPITASWASAVFTCSCVLPTMLHIVLSVGQVVAAERLQHLSVFCAAPKRITLGGKVRVVCFDKTGTLTTPSLEFFGVHCVRRPEGAPAQAGPFSGWVARAAQGASSPQDEPDLEDEPRKESWSPEVHCGLASAHSLSPFAQSESGVVGNAVEVNMFKASGWTLPSQTEVVTRGPQEQKVNILRRFDFSHSTMTMSAVVAHSPSGERGVYCKGSFEQVAARCLKSSVPPGFAAKAQRHAYSGMYVLALATRPLKQGEDAKLADLTREEVEKDLVLLGMLLFKNPLRGDTRDTIERLRGGEVRSVMITGDASGTAIKIAKEAALVQSGMPVLLGDIEAGGDVVWRSDVEDLGTLNELLLSNEWLTWRRNYKQWRQGDTKGSKGEAEAKKVKGGVPDIQMARTLSWHLGDDEGPADGDGPQEFAFSTEEIVLSRLFEFCELAVTQRALEWLAKTECSPDLRRVLLGSRTVSLKKGKALSSGKGDSSLAWELMTSIRIFARMTPSGKVNVVESLMSQGLICAMVGDGGNDSGALRTAHVGMALSSATSATVVAPFTTNRGSVAPIVDLCREGRAALATSFAGYKFCTHYGLTNSGFKFISYYYGITQTMAACYFQDIGGFLSLSWAMTLAKPAPTLVGERPTSSLFSIYTMTSVLGMWLINTMFLKLAFAWITSHEDYVVFPIHLVSITQWWKRSRSWESTCIFFVYTLQFFWSAVVFSFGHLFRLPWYQNLVLFGIAAGAFVFVGTLLLGPASDLTRLFHLSWELENEHEPWSPMLSCPPMPYSLRWELAVIIMTGMAVTAAWEKVIVQGQVGIWARNRCRRMSKHITVRL